MSLIFNYPFTKRTLLDNLSGVPTPDLIYTSTGSYDTPQEYTNGYGITNPKGLTVNPGGSFKPVSVPLKGYPKKNFTLCYWFRYSSDAADGYVSKSTAPNIEMGIRIVRRPSDILMLVNNYSSDIYGTLDTTGITRYSAWIHCAITVDADNNLSLYLFGNLIKTEKITYSGATSVFEGDYSLCGNYAYYQDFKYWDECLPQAKIREEALGLVCHFNFSAGVYAGQENILGNLSALYGNGGSVTLDVNRPSARYLKWHANADLGPAQGAYMYFDGNPNDGIHRSTSFDYRIVTPDGRDLNSQYFGWEAQYGYGLDYKSVVHSGEWYHFHGTHTGSANAFITYTYDTVPAGTIFELKHVKVESGTQETNWRPNHISWTEGALDTAMYNHVILNRVIGHEPFFLGPQGKDYSSNGMVESYNIRKDGYGTWYLSDSTSLSYMQYFTTDNCTLQFVIAIDPSLGGRQEFVFSTGTGWVYSGLAMWLDPGGSTANILMAYSSGQGYTVLNIPVTNLYGHNIVLTIRRDYSKSTFSAWINGNLEGILYDVPGYVILHSRFLELMRGYYADITGNDEKLYGYISDFKFWATALTDDEIRLEAKKFRPHADKREFYVPMVYNTYPAGCNERTHLHRYGMFLPRGKKYFNGLHDDFTQYVVADETSLSMSWDASEQAYYAANYWESSVSFHVNEYAIYLVELEMRCTNRYTTDAAYIGIRTCVDYNCNHVMTDRNERTSTPSTDPWDTYCMIHNDSNYKKMVFFVIGAKTSLSDVTTYYCESGNDIRIDLALRPDRAIDTNIQCRSNVQNQEYYVREFRVIKIR